MHPMQFMRCMPLPRVGPFIILMCVADGDCLLLYKSTVFSSRPRTPGC